MIIQTLAPRINESEWKANEGENNVMLYESKVVTDIPLFVERQGFPFSYKLHYK